MWPYRDGHMRTSAIHSVSFPPAFLMGPHNHRLMPLHCYTIRVFVTKLTSRGQICISGGVLCVCVCIIENYHVNNMEHASMQQCKFLINVYSEHFSVSIPVTIRTLVHLLSCCCFVRLSFRLSFFIYAKPYASDYLLQSSGSSSEPSEQSFSWSQSHRLNMHRPLLLHLNLSSLHTTSANRKVEIEMKITVAYHCDDIINFISR